MRRQSELVGAAVPHCFCCCCCCCSKRRRTRLGARRLGRRERISVPAVSRGARRVSTAAVDRQPHSPTTSRQRVHSQWQRVWRPRWKRSRRIASVRRWRPGVRARNSRARDWRAAGLSATCSWPHSCPARRGPRRVLGLECGDGAVKAESRTALSARLAASGAGPESRTESRVLSRCLLRHSSARQSSRSVVRDGVGSQPARRRLHAS